MDDIKKQMKRGLFWTAIDKYSGQIIGILISMVLARLLTPYDYGVVATASVILGFLTIFTSLGIGAAIIQRNDLSKSDLDNIFTFSVLLGLGLGALSFSTSWFIADYYGNQLLKPVVQILSIGLFAATINMVPAAMMSKNQRFKEMATRSLAFQVIFGLIGIVSAFYGAGVYALVCPQILASFCTFLYNNHFYPVRISFKFSIEPVKKIFSYSIYIFMFGVINYFSRNLDKLIIGKYISAEALGYYEKSYRLMQMPLNNITSVVDPVIQPVMSSLQDNMHEMAEKYSKLIGYIGLVSFPIAMLLYFNAEDIIYCMFGDQWVNSVPIFRILSLSIPTQVILSTSGSIFNACNATKTLFIVGTMNTCMVVTGFLIGTILWGTSEAIAWGWTLTSVLTFLNTYVVMYKFTFKSSIVNMLKKLVHPFISAILLCFLYFCLDFVVIGILPICSLIFKLTLGVITTLIYLQVTHQFNVIKFVKTSLKR